MQLPYDGAKLAFIKNIQHLAFWNQKSPEQKARFVHDLLNQFVAKLNAPHTVECRLLCAHVWGWFDLMCLMIYLFPNSTMRPHITMSTACCVQESVASTRQACATNLELKLQQNARRVLQSRLEEANAKSAKLTEENLVRCCVCVFEFIGLGLNLHVMLSPVSCLCSLSCGCAQKIKTWLWIHEMCAHWTPTTQICEAEMHKLTWAYWWHKASQPVVLFDALHEARRPVWVGSPDLYSMVLVGLLFDIWTCLPVHLFLR